MELVLERKFKRANCTEGNLYINGKWFCNTLEDVVRAGPGKWKKEIKVYAKTAIPYGRYPVLVTYSPRFKRMMVGVFNVPNFEGIRFHWGVSETNSAGCILISFNDDDANHKLVLDKAATEQLIKLVETAQKNEKVFLTILDKY